MEPKAQSSSGRSEADLKLLQAIVACRVTDVRTLLRSGADPHTRTAEGKSALHLIMQINDYGVHSTAGRELLAIFLNKNLDINVRDPQGVTPLHQAALGESFNAARNKMEDLLNFGADINARDKQGQTPLHFAATVKAGPALKYLIEREADINAPDILNRTPLHLAAMRGDAEMLKLLLTAGARVNIKTRGGKYPWDLAETSGYDYLAQTLRAEGRKQQLAEEKKKAAMEPWALLDEDRVSHTRVEKKIGYCLTEIFNFNARTYTKIARNLQSGVEGLTVKSFDDFFDKALLEHAHENLVRLGGVADRNRIHYGHMNKPSRPPRLK